MFETYYTTSPVYFWIAMVSTALFLVKFLMTIIGADTHGDADAPDLGDGFDDAHPASTASFQLLSLQSILAFFMGFGWMGLILGVEQGWEKLPTILVSAVFGGALMLGTSYLYFLMYKLNAAGSYDLSHTVGQSARVYLAIPAHSEGRGQVELTVDGRLKVVTAESVGPAIESFRNVRIVSVDAAAEVVTVEPLD